MKSTRAPADTVLRASAATVDITPPVGIHLGNWGYAGSQVSTGVHRVLEAKLLALDLGGARALLVAVDLGWWMSAADEEELRHTILEASGVAESALILCLTHTHAGPSVNRLDKDEPGGDLIAPYLDRLAADVSGAARDTWARLEPAELSWIDGRCTLAVNRDLRLPDGRWVVGQNPRGVTDDTLLVGRLTRPDGSILAILASYAVHPTSLGGDNTLISPDLVGRARELVETATGSSFIFLQGASGDMSPRVQYSADPGVADRNGEALGFAVLSALAAQPPTGELHLTEIVESGAPLAVFSAGPTAAVHVLSTNLVLLDLETRDNTPPSSGDSAEHDPATVVRRMRADRVRANVGSGRTRFPLTVWYLGSATIFAYPGEAYSAMAVELRRRHPGRHVVLVNLANGAHHGYIAPRAAYADGRYPAWQSPLAPGAFETLLEECDSLLSAAPLHHPNA